MFGKTSCSYRKLVKQQQVGKKTKSLTKIQSVKKTESVKKNIYFCFGKKSDKKFRSKAKDARASKIVVRDAEAAKENYIE